MDFGNLRKSNKIGALFSKETKLFDGKSFQDSGKRGL